MNLRMIQGCASATWTLQVFCLKLTNWQFDSAEYFDGDFV